MCMYIHIKPMFIIINNNYIIITQKRLIKLTPALQAAICTLDLVSKIAGSHSADKYTTATCHPINIFVVIYLPVVVVAAGAAGAAGAAAAAVAVVACLMAWRWQLNRKSSSTASWKSFEVNERLEILRTITTTGTNLKRLLIF
uniref:Uncharacterized protein n=1 Tax=Glossina austeni TaxID=7395 RepID=A0A1A9US04_GLOAU